MLYPAELGVRRGRRLARGRAFVKWGVGWGSNGTKTVGGGGGGGGYGAIYCFALTP